MDTKRDEREREAVRKAAALLGRKGGATVGRGTGAAKRRGGDTPEAVSTHMRDVRAKRRRHLPRPGVAVGLRGEALCGRIATYATGDHDMIRRLAATDPAGYCEQCLAAQAR